MPRSNPRVVILGAGFGGLEATKTLRHAPVEIILIDRQNYQWCETQAGHLIQVKALLVCAEIKGRGCAFCRPAILK
jgi:hypothetical protein